MYGAFQSPEIWRRHLAVFHDNVHVGTSIPRIHRESQQPPWPPRKEGVRARVLFLFVILRLHALPWFREV